MSAVSPLSGPDLLPLENALNHILEQLVPVTGVEQIPLEQSLGRLLADDQLVPEDVPPADNSTVDGYAVNTDGLMPEQPLQISARIAAGHASGPLAAGTAARIFTGAEIPAGANAVVMQENTRTEGTQVWLEQHPEAGQNIQRRGQDLRQGDRALARGKRIRPQEMGLLASLGKAEVPVRRRLRVAVLTTGDELVQPGKPLAPGQIYNSNTYTLQGLLAQAGADATLCLTVTDTREATYDALARAAENADLIITSGGVSVGEEDHLRAVLEETGQLSLWRLAIKPGKPLAFGGVNGTPVLGLPGNPAAVLVTFLLVGLPVVRTLEGDPHPVPTGESFPAAFSVDQPSVRREFRRARLEHHNGELCVISHTDQSSGMLSSACWADGLAVIPENTILAEGDPVTYFSFTELWG